MENKTNALCFKTLMNIKRENPELEKTIEEILKQWWFLTEEEKKAIVYYYDFQYTTKEIKLTIDHRIGIISIEQFVQQADKINGKC